MDWSGWVVPRTGGWVKQRFDGRPKGSTSRAFSDNARLVAQRLKANVIVPTTRTGVPESSVGVKRHPRAASSAGPRRSGWPESTRLEITAPVSETVTSTTTLPETPTAFADSGYRG